MDLGFTIVFVDDVDATADFWRSAFGVDVAMATPTFVAMATGQTMVAFRRAEDERAELAGAAHFRPNSLATLAPGVQLSFVTDDVASAYARAVAAGAVAVVPPTTQPWGQTVSRVRDLNGILVGIVSPMHASA